MFIKSFEELPLQEELSKVLLELNYLTPTPIQSQAIPPVLENKDIIGQAQTGTGKTLAYTLPILQRLDQSSFNIETLILCPTRELAIQVTKEIRKLTKYLESIRVVPVYGGQSYDIQINALKRKPQIIVGTPGRIIDLMERSLLKFGNVKYVVLDEADEMLKMGFQEDLETILGTTPKTRQTLMFSATIPTPILEIANRYLQNYEQIKIENKTITVDKINQTYYYCRKEEKVNILIRLLDFYSVESAIVFCNTKQSVDELVLTLQENHYNAEGIHGDLKQGQRDRVMNAFRTNYIKILVATDVAARGLDINDVEAVFNFDCPLEEESYVHRIGRTGRAGKSGLAFTFITKRQEYRIQQIENYIHQKIVKANIPSLNDLTDAKNNSMYITLKQDLLKGDFQIDPTPIERLINEGFSKDKIIEMLYFMISKDKMKRYEDIEEISEPKKRERKSSDARKERDRKPSEERRERDRKPRENRDIERKPVEESEIKAERKQGKRVLLLLNVGSKNDVKVMDVLDFFNRHYRLTKNDLGTIEITKKATYVEINEKDALYITRNPKKNSLKNQEVQMEIIN